MLYITNVSLRYEITPAKLLMESTPGRLEVETEKNGYQIDSHPIQIQIDNSEFFQSIGIKPASVVLRDAAQRGKDNVYKTMARYSSEASAMLGPDGLTVAEIAAERSIKDVSTAMTFIPAARPEISWKDGYVDINYVKDERNVNWVPPEMEFTYIPYKVEIYAEKWFEKYPPEKTALAG